MESAFLFFLYDWNYNEMKKTPIIGALKCVFFMLTAVFGGISFVILLNDSVQNLTHLLINIFLIIILFLLLHSLGKFRHFSMFNNEEKNKNLLKDVKGIVSKALKKKKG